MEGQELLPLPFFITGVDGHIAVRDSLTSQWETNQVCTPYTWETIKLSTPYTLDDEALHTLRLRQ